MNVNANLMEESITQINGGITINIDVSVKSIIYAKKIILGILLHIYMKMENKNNSAIMCDEIIESYDEETKIVLTNFNENNITCETQNFYTLFAFLLIAIALLIALVFTVT